MGAFVQASVIIKLLSEGIFPKQARWPEKQTFQTAIIVSIRKARDENQSVPISVSNAALSASRDSVFRYSSSNIWQVSIRTSRCIARSRGGTCQCCAIPWDHSIPRNHRRRSLPRMDSGCYGAALWIYGLPCSVRCFAIRLIFPATGKRKT